uniref:Ovule protein n=1 Tax=Brugia timori TaxID=42155 RepID=A0A0R3Q4V1_9BILA
LTWDFVCCYFITDNARNRYELSQVFSKCILFFVVIVEK